MIEELAAFTSMTHRTKQESSFRSDNGDWTARRASVRVSGVVLMPMMNHHARHSTNSHHKPAGTKRLQRAGTSCSAGQTLSHSGQAKQSCKGDWVADEGGGEGQFSARANRRSFDELWSARSTASELILSKSMNPAAPPARANTHFLLKTSFVPFR